MKQNINFNQFVDSKKKCYGGNKKNEYKKLYYGQD